MTVHDNFMTTHDTFMTIHDPIYIVPPGLRYKVREFEAHCRVAGTAPIMICGPSGVGKALFLHIFKQFCRKNAEPERFVATVNCSHFSGDVARSELFGHVRGAFTGAVEEKEGWLQRANGGVLILEEVGDLPPETQAKLLSFVETGEYHKVGDAVIRSSRVQIVAATNRYEMLRDDFRHRFFPFHVPPLHERRGDVLYHLAATIPELLSQLASWEILALLAHRWPGNVRELERTALLLKRRKLLESEDPGLDLLEAVTRAVNHKTPADSPTAGKGPDPGGDRLTHMAHYKNVILGENRTYRLCQALKATGVDIKTFHALLRRYHLGIILNRDDLAFDDLQESSFTSCLRHDGRLGVTYFNAVAPFEEAEKGLRIFCSLLERDPTADQNLLEPSNGRPGSSERRPPVDLDDIPEVRDLAPAFRGLLQSEGPNTDTGKEWMTAMSRDQLMKAYYRALLSKTLGNKSEAARLAGLKYTTFREALKKYEIR